MKALLRWLGSCHFPLLMLASLFPSALLLLHIAFPGAPAAAPALLCACLPCSMLLAAVPGRRRLPAAALVSALLLTVGAIALPLDAQPLLLLVPIACCALVLASLPLVSRGIHGISPALYVFGAASHILANVFFRLRAAGASDDALLSRYLAAAFFLYLPLFLLAMNRITLDNASLSRYRLPSSMQRVNILLTLGFLALSLLIASLPAAARALFALWHALRRGVRALGALLSRLLPQAPGMGGAGMGAGPFPLLGEAASREPSPLSAFLEQLASLLAAAVLIAGSLVLLRMLFAAAIRLLRKALIRLRRFAASASEDYVDEITATRTEEGWRESILSQRRRRRSARGAPDTPVTAVRYRYARLRKKHAAWSDSSTARENLPPQAAGIYERARYSDHAVSQADAEDFVRITNHL